MGEIRYFNRYSQKEEVEEIYGEPYLRWTYDTAMGRLGLWLVAKRVLFSRWYGWRMNRPASAKKIRPFMENYSLDTSEFLEDVSKYSSFNDFFYRKLKPEARPIEGDEDCVSFPADGRHLGITDLSGVDGLYAKGQNFDLSGLLGDAELAARYEGGSAVISRLCPVDYHRYHAPVGGEIVEQRLINGWLFSVSPIALRRSVDYLWENKRVLTIINTERLGQVAFVAIGATLVGSIKMTVNKGITIARGEELGYFAFGGSCVITLFEKGQVKLEADLRSYGSQQTEIYAKVGDLMARQRQQAKSEPRK